MPDLEVDYTGILEPGPFSSQGLLAACTLAPVQAGLTYVRVMNSTNTDLNVPCDTRLGDIHPLGKDNGHDYAITEVDKPTTAMIAESTSRQALPDINLDQLTLRLLMNSDKSLKFDC